MLYAIDVRKNGHRINSLNCVSTAPGDATLQPLMSKRRKFEAIQASSGRKHLRKG